MKARWVFFEAFLKATLHFEQLKLLSFEISFDCFEWNLNFSDYDNYLILKELAIHNDIILGFSSFNHNSKADNIIDFMKGFSRFLF